MKKYKILVTGVGAIIGYGIIHSLKKSRYDPVIVGIDIHSDAIGAVWCDFFKQGVPAASPEFPSFLIGVIQTYGIDLVIPGIEQDIMSIVVHLDRLRDAGAVLAVNNPEIVHLFHDKWLTHQFLCKNGIEAIRSYCDGDYDAIKAEIGPTMLVKPRCSYASKGIQYIDSPDDFCYWKRKLGHDFMVQEIIGDDEHEYTIAIFGLGDGSYCNFIMLKRKLSVDGSTAKAWSFYDERAEDIVKKICLLSKPVGPTNFQLRHHRGTYYLLEVNPRISSTTSIRQALGYNEAEMCVEYFLEHKTPGRRSIRQGSAVRYIADHVTYDSTDS